MKIKSGLLKFAAVVTLFAVLILSSLASPMQQADALQATQAATKSAVPSYPALPESMANALVPCAAGVTGPCELIATKAEDIAGVWKQYLGGPFNPPTEMAYIRFNIDGTFHLADTIEHTTDAFKNYPTGTFIFNGQQWITPVVLAGNAAPPCKFETSAYQVRVLKYGDKPVALRFVNINDDCAGRVQDFSQALVWVAPNTK